MRNIEIPPNGKVYTHLCELDVLYKNGGVSSLNAGRELEQFWFCAERLKGIASASHYNNVSLKDSGLKIKKIAQNRYGLAIESNVYLFEDEGNSFVFLTICKPGLERNEIVLCEADYVLKFWKKSKSTNEQME
jgi:hypothetical protein